MDKRSLGSKQTVSVNIPTSLYMIPTAAAPVLYKAMTNQPVTCATYITYSRVENITVAEQ